MKSEKMYEYKIKPQLDKILDKLTKKDKVLFHQVMDKIQEIVNSYNIDHYKNLKYGMKDYKRVHVGSFVLIFKLENNTLIFEDLDHHDNIYK